jgi:hypothetical protein
MKMPRKYAFSVHAEGTALLQRATIRQLTLRRCQLQGKSEEVAFIDIFINCSWVVTRWQYKFTHKHYIEQHK